MTSLRLPGAVFGSLALVSLLSIGAGCWDAPGPEGVDDAGAPDTDRDGGPPALAAVAPRDALSPGSKGIWIWHVESLGASPDEVAQRCADDGIGYVLIKSGQDGRFWDQRFNADLVAAFTARGVAVYAWAYMTPAGLSEGAAAAALKALAVPNVVGMVLDVEAEFEGASESAAEDLCNQIRGGTSAQVFLGYTSFGWVGDHKTFPYAAFDRTCGDAFFPQIYWSDRGISESRGYTEAQQMIAEAGLGAMVWPVQSNDLDGRTGNAPRTEDLNAFFDRAGPLSSLWEFPHFDDAVQLEQLAELHWRNP
jgi:hypothetical protein